MNFDGKDYPQTGPQDAPGSTSSGKRLDAHTLEITDKINGKIVDHGKYVVSPDGTTLTITQQDEGQPNSSITVYDKI
jgi:hypothetical protein